MKDKDIRVLIKKSYLQKFYNDHNSKVVDELNVCHGEARIDIAVINGYFHGYEIKSEYDTLFRISHQLEVYSKIFDYLTFICGEKHLENILKIIPEWCGIMVAKNIKNNQPIRLKKYRTAKKNNLIDKFSIAQLLWKEEVIFCLNEIGITKSLSGKNKFQLWQLLSQSLSEKELSKLVREKIKLREDWKSESLPFANDDCMQLSSKW